MRSPSSANPRVGDHQTRAKAVLSSPRLQLRFGAGSAADPESCGDAGQ
ncbi:MAG: hypothetical protein ACI8PQ_001679 [Planctomycetota bacterium]|jgi:hypothetical protein